ncbi:MAG TPA: hypothetical protein VFP87_10560 [Chitinophagaceae bacterium]|nr:hypothetical protein [Chitinophagaceae bacterium]
MKLAPLLAQYLYEEKKLDLAGIGTFLLDPSVRTGADALHASEGISFQYHTTARDDEKLVDFISRHTGKMKPLASSDLDSYLELALQFLNIGKPFQIEGIGTLVKNKSGALEFTPGHLLVDKGKESGIKELSATSTSDESLTTYESLKPHVDRTPPYKAIFLTFLVLATTGVIIWAGYRMYKNNSGNKSADEEQTVPETTPVTDSAKYVAPQRDTTGTSSQNLTTTATQNEATNKNTYHFVIEVANKQRAMRRYTLLKKGGVPVQISTDDSINYKLFFVLSATPSDTARISDSLTTWYPALNHKRTFAE